MSRWQLFLGKLCGLGLLGLVTMGLLWAPAAAQENPTGTLAGQIMDPSNAAIPGANILVVDPSTGIALKAQSGSNGHFAISNVAPGTYTVTVTKTGFQTATYKAVEIAANQIYNLKSNLKVGSQSSTITVEAGQSVIQPEQTSVSSTISGKVITELPSTSGEGSLYQLTQTNPAVQTMGSPRQSSAEGLPGGAINITIDGISAQWESGKSGDPMFTMITPNASDTGEFDMVTSAGTANQTGEGAVQVNIISKRGTNTFHGSLYDYLRNTSLNSNYYFNNLAGQPRPIMRYNWWGFSIGGPVIKNKLYFFFDFSRQASPEGAVQNATILNPKQVLGGNANNGVFDYVPVNAQNQPTMPTSTPAWETCSQQASGPVCQANLLQMASSNGYNGTADPFMAGVLGKMSSAAAVSGVTLTTPPSPYQQTLAFPESGSNVQENPDFRADYNINSSNSLEFDYHMSRLIIYPDALNGGGYTFPVAPFNSNQYGYAADRAIWATAWRWAVTPSMSNELRAGFQNSPSEFNYNQSSAEYPKIATNLGSIQMQPVLPGVVTNPYHGFGLFTEWDNVYQLNDNLAWVRGNHNWTFGMTATRARFSDQNSGNTVATVNVGMSGSEPVLSDFTGTNLPGISNNDLTAAENIYGMVTGNVTGYNSSVAFDPNKRNFVTGIPGVDHMHQTDFGFYAADSWHMRSNLTFNYGLRWEYEGVPVDDYNQYFIANGGLAGLYGVSGVGNLFKPGTLTGSTPTFTNDLGKQWYHNWYKGFAPSIGFAWQPKWNDAIFGHSGETVLRGGYSIAYDREGLGNYSSIAQGNPGYFGSQQANAAPPSANQPAGLFSAGSVQINNMSIPSVAQNPTTFQSTIPISPIQGNGINVFDPNLHMPYVETWNLGWQRQLGSHRAIEIDYVGNHGVGLWQQLNLNEVNIFENGFLQEFKQAQSNLASCMADPTCSQNPTFADTNLPGQQVLPIMTAAFTGSKTGPQNDGSFSNGGFIRDLQNGQAGSLANSLATNYTRWQNMVTAGLPSNEFLVNPDAQGGAYLLRNALQSTYNALVLEYRQRPVSGFTFNASYVFSKSLTNDWQRNGSNYLNEVTLRNPGYMNGPAPYDIRNQFKFYSVWDLPFGHGQRFGGNSGSMVNRLIGGWQLSSDITLQSGRPGLISGGLGGTFNQYDGGVQLTGMSVQQLQSKLGVYKTSTPAPGAVWYVPQNLLGANGQGANSAVLSGCGTPGALCQRMFLYDAPFFMPNISLIKNTPITERVNFELQAQFLDAFNNANFFWTGSAETFGTAGNNLQSSRFGQITHAFQAPDATSMTGGRSVQIVARITF